MKNLFTIILLAFACAAFGQSSKGNQERLNEIETEIQAAVDAGNFEKAARLKEEKTTRLAIKEAVKAGNFEEANRLKSELTSTGQAGQQNASNNNSSNVYVEKERESAFDEVAQKPDTDLAKLLKSGIYVELGLGYSSPSSSVSDVYGGSFAVKLNGGWKIFFTKKGKRLRLGLDAQIVSFVPQFGEVSVFEFYFLRPGFTASLALNKKMAIDASLNIGPAYGAGNDLPLYGTYSYSSSDQMYDYQVNGVCFSQSARLRLNKWACAGFDISYSTMSGSGYAHGYDGVTNETFSITKSSFIIAFVTGFKF